MNFVFFILILVVLILVHEFGHFAVAKLSGIRVEEFAIGFPPRLLKIQKGDTLYSINLLLFGGYVRMLGENEIASGQVTTQFHPDERSFAFASGWKQAAITLAGIGMNFVFAWLAFIAVFLAGIQVDANAAAYPQYLANEQVTIEGIAPDSPADKAGLQSGDIVRSAMSGSDALATGFTSADFQRFTAAHSDADMTLAISRGRENKTVTLRPAAGIVPDRAAIGVELADLADMRLPLPLAIVQGSESFGAATAATAAGLGGFAASIFRGHGDFSQVSGPVGIAELGAQSVAQGFSMAMLFAAVISINLAILNLLPIPGLDGGRLLFIIIERIKGSAIDPRLATWITVAGFALLITLMIIVTYHDIARLI